MPTPEEIKKADDDRIAVEADKKTAEELAAKTAAEQKKTEQEHMIPKSRLDEVLGKNRELESRLAAIEKASKDATAAVLKEQGKFQELYDQTLKELAETKPLAAVAVESERTLKMVLDAQVEELPEHLRGLIPDELTTQQKLAWLSKNKAMLLKPKAFDIGAGKTGGGAPEGSTELTAEELQTAKSFGYTPEEYAKYKYGDKVKV